MTGTERNYIVYPMTAMSMGIDVPIRANEYPTFDAAEAAAIAFTMSEPWRTHAQLLYRNEQGWHRNWYRRQGTNGPLTIERD